MATFDNITFEIIEDSESKTGYPEKANIKYKDFDKVVPKTVLPTVLGLFLSQEKSSLTPLEFVDKVRGERKTPEPAPIPTPTPRPEPTPSPKPEDTKGEDEEKGRKKKKSGIIVKFIAGAGILAILGTGGYLLAKHLDESNKERDNQGSLPPVRFEEQVSLENQPIADIPIQGEQLLQYINRRSTDLIAMSDEEFLNALNDQTIASLLSMPEISVFVDGGELEGEKHITNIQNTFRYQSPDFCIVEHFNQCRNDIECAAYDTCNVANVKNVQDIHMKHFYLFCTNQESVTLNTSEGEVTFYWNTLSDEVRNAILDIMWGIEVSLPHDYILSVNGVNLTPEQIATFIDVERAKLTALDEIYAKTSK